jgi:hypothetical protein
MKSYTWQKPLMNKGMLDETGAGRDFAEREKQDVFPAAPREGFTAIREIPSCSSLCAREKLFMNGFG